MMLLVVNGPSYPEAMGMKQATLCSDLPESER